MTKESIYKSEKGKQEILGFYEKVIREWPQASQQITITTSHGDTFVLESGLSSARKIVLLHGSGSNSAMWMADVMEYSKSFHVFAIDIIGECGKSSENRPPWNEKHYSEWLSEVFKNLNIGSATLIGNSLGGSIAIDFAINFPEKADKLVLIATAGITPIKLSSLFWIILTSIFGDWGFKKLNKMVYGNLEIDPKALKFAGLVKQYFKPRTDVLPLFTDEKLQSIQIPTLFIGGENDCFYDSKKTAVRLSKQIAKFKSEVLIDTGHVVINQALKINDFLKEG